MRDLLIGPVCIAAGDVGVTMVLMSSSGAAGGGCGKRASNSLSLLSSFVSNVLSMPSIFSRAKAGHKCREGCHGPLLFLAEVAGEPFVTDAMFKGR